MKPTYFFLFSFLFFGSMTKAQTLARLEVNTQKPLNGLAAPASINLDAITFLPDSALSMVAVQGNSRTAVPFQIRQEEKRMLYWQVAGGTGTKRTYELVKSAPNSSAAVSARFENGQITFQSGGKNLLNYVHKTVYPPQGIDTAYKRSGFIHPLWTPKGQELTRIQAPDHYHHYGIWNPWTHVLFEGDTVDFWNLKDRKGTVRSARILSHTSGDVFAEMEALHEHVAFKKDGSEKVALNEVQTVRVYRPQEGSDYYLVDIISKMSPASGSPFEILEYRYAGMGWRTTEYWDDNNCEVLTSEGKTRKDTDNTRSRWCIVQGALPGEAYGGAAFLSYPANYNHPEPMRIWAPGTNRRGDMFFSYAPTKDRNWLLEPGKTYIQQYRLLVFNGKIAADKVETAWQYYAAPPVVKVTLSK